MNNVTWDILSWAFLVVPILFGIVALRLGARQVREFHEHTGDTGVIMSLTALSRFHDDAPAVAASASPTKPAHVQRKQKL